MKKISLNFFGEKVDINLPTTLGSLRNLVAEQFFFDPVDVVELVISYVKDFTRTIIKTEIDFKKIFDLEIKELSLDISENSRLYQATKQSALQEDTSQFIELKKLRKTVETLHEEKEKIFQERKIELEKIRTEMKFLKMKYKKKFIEIDQAISNKTELIIETEKQIEEMETKLELPHKEKKSEQEQKLENENEMKFRKFLKQMRWKNKHCYKRKQDKVSLDEEKKMAHIEEKQNKHQYQPNLFKILEKTLEKIKNFTSTEFTDKQLEQLKNALNPQPKAQEVIKPKDIQKKKVHSHVFCDGCRMFPIIGTRFKCMNCQNFDYCADCEEKYSEIHQHPFLCIRDPKMNIKQDLPLFDRRIHNN